MAGLRDAHLELQRRLAEGCTNAMDPRDGDIFVNLNIPIGCMETLLCVWGHQDE